MKLKRWFAPLGVLACLVLGFVSSGNAQSCTSLPGGAPWQLGVRCSFTASSSPVDIGSAAGIAYWEIFAVPSGTVSAASLSVDSSPDSISWTTGGIIGSATIGSLASSASYANSSATTPTNFAQLTPSVTGTGSVTVIVFGYVNNPAASGGGSGGTVTATQSSGSNLHVNVDNNQTSASGALTNSSSSTCTGASVGSNGVTIATAGAATVGINVTGTNTATIGFYYSVDGANYQAVPSGMVFSRSGGASVTGFSANGQFIAFTASISDFMVCGPAGSTQTATITLEASLAPGVVFALDTAGYQILADMLSGTSPGTAPTHTSIVGGVYTAAGIAPSNGQAAPFQLTATGALMNAALPAPGSALAPSTYSSISLTTAVAVKASTGNIYGLIVTNGSTSTACYLEIINASSSPSLGTNVLFSIPIPASTSTAPSQVIMPVGAIPYSHLTTGISVGLTTAAGGSTACGTAGDLVLWYE